MYHIIYLIIHAIFRVCTTLTSFLSVLEQYLRSLFYAKTANENDLFLTELGKTGLIKVPQHVAIIFNDTNQKLEPLARLIRWIILTGVRYITFYDFRGIFIDCDCSHYFCYHMFFWFLSRKLGRDSSRHRQAHGTNQIGHTAPRLESKA